MLLWGSTKALNVAKLATLHASLLLTSFSLSDCSSTRDAFVNAHTHTGISGLRPIRGGVRPSLSLIGLDHYISLTGCLLLNHRVSELRILFFLFFLFSNGWTHQCALGFLLVAPERN